MKYEAVGEVSSHSCVSYLASEFFPALNWEQTLQPIPQGTKQISRGKGNGYNTHGSNKEKAVLPPLPGLLAGLVLLPLAVS